MKHADIDVETDLVDLSAMSIADLCALDESQLAASMVRVTRQIERPRKNLGGSGPPGRAD